ncbi:MAG: hypothetical protein OXT67_02675, partial [Zetaproteobacteria bacterium]|nr:hypothetical protein [Zetaproteobacteria bacterium]
PQQDLPDNPEPPEPNYVSDNDVDRRAIEDAEFGDYGIKPDGEYKVDVTYFRPTLEVKINPANLLVLATQMISPESGDPAQQAAKWMNVANATWALGEGADQFTHAWTEYLAGRRTRGELYKVWMETISAGGKIAAGAGTATLKSKSPIYAAGVGTTDVGSYDDQRIDRTLERQIHQARQQPPQTPPGDIEAPPSEQRQAAQSDDPRRSQGSAAESWSTFFRETQGNGNILRSLLRFNPMTIGLARKALEGGVNFATNFKLGAGISLAKPLDIAPEVLFPILHGKLPLSQRGAQALPPNLDLVEVITNIGRIHFQDADAGRAAKAALALELASFIYYTGQVSTGNMDTILYEVYATGPDGEKTGKPLHSYTYPPSHQMPGVGTREQLMQLYPHHRTHPVSRQGRIRGRDYVSALNELHNQIDRKNLQAFAIFQTRRAQIIQNRQGLVEKLLEVLPDPARRLAADHLDDLLQDATWDNRHTLDGVPDELQRSRGFALYNFKLILLEQLKQQDPVKDILTRNGYPQQFLLHKLNKPDEFNEKFTKLRKVVDDHILPAIHPQLTLVGQANDKQRAAFALLQSPKFLQMINQKATSDRFAQLLSLKRQLISAYYGFAPDNPAGLFSQKKSLDHIHECVGTICAQIEDRLQNKNVDLDQRTLRDALAGLDSLESAMKTGHKHVHDLYRDILAAERKPTPGLLSTWRETFTQPLITLRSMVNPPKYGAERGAREAEAWLKLGGTRLSVAVPNAFTSLSFFQDLGRLGSSVRQIVRSARAVPPSAEVGPSEVPSSTGGRTRYIWGEGAYIEPDPYRPISNVADPYVRVAPAPDTNSSQPKASPSTPRIRGGRLHLTGSASSPSSRCGLAVPYLASTLDHLSSQLNYLHSQLDLLYVLQGSAY